MSRKQKTNPQSNAELLKKKDERIAELEKQLARALAIIEMLQKEVEELKRVGKRQAAPFARRKLVERPKRSGHKQGHVQFSHRSKFRLLWMWSRHHRCQYKCFCSCFLFHLTGRFCLCRTKSSYACRCSITPRTFLRGSLL